MNILQPLNNMTIRGKLLILSGVLLLAMLGTNMIAMQNVNNMQDSMTTMRGDIAKIRDQAQSVQEVLGKQQNTLNRLDIANASLRVFGEVKYWFADLSASWLNESEKSAKESVVKMAVLLDQLKTFAPSEAESVRKHIDNLSKLSLKAVDAFSDDNRVLGNSLLSDSRKDIVAADNILMKLVEDQKKAAQNAKEEALNSADSSVDEAAGVIANTDISIEKAATRTAATKTILVVAVIISIILTIIIIGSLVRPIRGIIMAMTKLAAGDLNVELPPVSKNEIGQMSKAVLVFKENAVEKQRMEKEQVEAETRAEREKKKAMNDLALSFESKVGGVLSSVASGAEQLKTTSGTLSTLAESGSSQAAGLAASTEEASNSVSSVASAAEEMSISIDEINKQISRSTKIANAAVEKTKEANLIIDELLGSAVKIGQITELINDIAEQINLLALNATIESARAGDAGKGFAVVASEVKNLANQTTKAIGDISAHITATQEKTNDTVKVIKEIGATNNELNEIFSSVSASMEEQGAAIQEIVRSAQNTARLTQEASDSVSNVAEASEKTGDAANEMDETAKDLAMQFGTLRKEVDNFLANIKAS